MKIIKVLLFTLPLLLSLTGCGGEDDLTPSDPDTNYFSVGDDATDATSLLRKAFYDKYGSYLLFNDTLSHVKTGTDAFGDPVYKDELLDVGYDPTGASNNVVYTYSYLTDINSQQQAANFVEQYILPHLGAKLRPFSFLLVGSINKYTFDSNNYTPDYDDPNPTAVVGDRATVFALDGILGSDEATMSSYASTVLGTILASKVAAQDATTLSSFTNYCKDLYGQWFMDLGLTEPADEESNMQAMYDAGFVVPHQSYGITFTGAYPSQAEDINGYIQLCLNSTADEVEQKYGSYLTIMEKYRIMSSLLETMGYVK